MLDVGDVKTVLGHECVVINLNDVRPGDIVARLPLPRVDRVQDRFRFIVAIERPRRSHDDMPSFVITFISFKAGRLLKFTYCGDENCSDEIRFVRIVRGR